MQMNAEDQGVVIVTCLEGGGVGLQHLCMYVYYIRVRFFSQNTELQGPRSAHHQLAVHAAEVVVAGLPGNGCGVQIAQQRNDSVKGLLGALAAAQGDVDRTVLGRAEVVYHILQTKSELTAAGRVL